MREATPAEIRLTHVIYALQAAGFLPVHLGPRILRTGTAGLAIAAVIQYRYGDWGKAPA